MQGLTSGHRHHVGEIGADSRRAVVGDSEPGTGIQSGGLDFDADEFCEVLFEHAAQLRRGEGGRFGGNRHDSPWDTKGTLSACVWRGRVDFRVDFPASPDDSDPPTPFAQSAVSEAELESPEVVKCSRNFSASPGVSQVNSWSERP